MLESSCICFLCYQFIRVYLGASCSSAHILPVYILYIVLVGLVCVIRALDGTRVLVCYQGL